MSALLVDDHGRIWDRRSLALGWNGSISDAELCQFVILNLGFIELAGTGRSIRVRLRPSVVSGAAVGALYYWLHQHRPLRVAVTWYDGRWQDEVLAWNSHGWRRITRLVESAEPQRQGFVRIEIASVALGTDNPLRALVEDPLQFHKIVSNPREMLPDRVRDRFVLLEEDIEHELRVRDFGPTMMSRSPSWQRKAIGLRAGELPDWRYGQWVEQAYRDVARRGAPLIEEVTAVINWPACGEVCHSYWRVILPGTTPRAPLRLLGVTLDRLTPRAHRAA